MTFFVRYWKGEISLAKSFWLVGISSTVLLLAFEAFIKYALTAYDLPPTTMFAVYELNWLLVVVVLIWQAVGIWRSATKHRHLPGRRAIWSWLAKGITLLGVAQFVAIFVITGVPQTREIYRVAFLGDPSLPDYALSLDEQNTELHIDGGIKFGLSDAVEQMLSANPSVATINLTSPGGRIKEAEKLYALIKRRQLNTVTNDQCMSACTYVFAGGARRWLGVNGQLGFHSGAFVGLNAAQVADGEHRVFERIEADDQVPAAFFQRVMGIDSKDIWYPTRDELLANHYLTEKRPGAASSQRELAAMVRVTAERLRRQLPETLGPRLILTEIAPEYTTLVYTYDVLSPDETKYFDQTTQNEMYSQLKTSTCNSKKAENAVEIGIYYQFRFKATVNGVNLLTVTINDCSGQPPPSD